MCWSWFMTTVCANAAVITVITESTLKRCRNGGILTVMHKPNTGAAGLAEKAFPYQFVWIYSIEGALPKVQSISNTRVFAQIALDSNVIMGHEKLLGLVIGCLSENHNNQMWTLLWLGWFLTGFGVLSGELMFLEALHTLGQRWHNWVMSSNLWTTLTLVILCGMYHCRHRDLTMERTITTVTLIKYLVCLMSNSLCQTVRPGEDVRVHETTADWAGSEFWNRTWQHSFERWIFDNCTVVVLLCTSDILLWNFNQQLWEKTLCCVWLFTVNTLI